MPNLTRIGYNIGKRANANIKTHLSNKKLFKLLLNTITETKARGSKSSEDRSLKTQNLEITTLERRTERRSCPEKSKEPNRILRERMINIREYSGRL